MEPSTLPIRDTSDGQCREDAHWYAVYTMPRHEKCAARQFEARSVDHFLPLYRTTRYWQHRHAIFDLPLFPSYLFVHITRQDRLKVLSTPGVLHLVGNKGSPAEIQDTEIDALRHLLNSRRAVPTAYMQPGDRVRFARGAFVGLEGKVIRSKSAVRVVISVDSIMRSISVEVDREELQLMCARSELQLPN